MPHYRGKDVVVTFNAVVISGDGRSASLKQSADALDDTTYGVDEKTKLAGLEDGSGSFAGLDSTGDWSAVWDEVAVGQTATMLIHPEGTGVGLREVSFTAIVTERDLDWPYDDLATFSMSFEISGAVSETEQT